MNIEQKQIDKFAAIYAEAVLTYLDSGEAQWVLWDHHVNLFDFASVELDQPSMPILLFVDESWSRLCEVDVNSEPDSPQFDAARLREAIETQMTDEGLGERILKTYLERVESGEEEEREEPEGPPPDSDDA